MPQWNRRQFLSRSGAGLGVALDATAAAAGQSATPVDFRYAPLSGQTAFCFPDDPAKSLVGERGELRYGFARGRFETVVGFSVTGVEPDVVARQELESPAVPIVHTRIDRAEAFLHLIAFATNRASEGRVDNVMVEIRPRTRRTVHAAPVVAVKSRRAVRSEGTAVYLDGDGGGLLFASDQPCLGLSDTGVEWVLQGKPGPARADEPLQQFFRFPQEGQPLEKIAAGLAEPDALLAEAREFWRAWRPFAEPVQWRVPGRYDEFLSACARNLLQARERKNGRLTFQVGPTVYRGLWVVDGNFILEAARYLGYDREAQQGLETTWALQEKDGGIFAGAGRAALERHRHRHVYPGAAGRVKPGLDLLPRDAGQRAARRSSFCEGCAPKPLRRAAHPAATACSQRGWAMADWAGCGTSSPTPSGCWPGCKPWNRPPPG